MHCATMQCIPFYMEKIEMSKIAKKSLAALAAASFLIALWAVGCTETGNDKAGTPVERNGRPNVLLVTLDTTRFDHLGCYGYEDIETPVIDGLAARGVVFERTYGSAPITLPNHATILTGTHPPFHGARNNGTHLVPESITTGAEMFKQAGYHTAAFIASFPLQGRFGLRQGFDVYDDRIEEGKEKKTFVFQERRASDVNRSVQKWLNRSPEKPFFAWVHYFDPHNPYEAPSPYRERYFQSPYDGEIAYTDAQLGKLLEMFEQRGFMENTIVVVTADHGESLGEHDEKTHAILIYYGTVQVPLIVHAPGIFPEGRRIGAITRSADILPTLLDYCGVTGHPDIQGVSLRPLIEGEREDLELEAFTETLAPYLHFRWSPLEGIRAGDYFYISAEPEELYNIKNDPKEIVDLAEKDEKTLKRMRRLFEQHQKAIQHPEELNSRAKLDSETMDKLNALGYIFSNTREAGEDEELPNPRFVVGMLERYFEGQSYLAMDKLDEAEKIFDDILDKDPEFGRALLGKGQLYVKRREFETAIDYFSQTLAALPEQADAYYSRARCHQYLGNLEEAEKDYLKGLELDPHRAEPYIHLSKIEMKRGQYQKVYELLQSAVDANIKSETAHFELAMFYLRAGKRDDAKNSFLQAREANPDFSAAPYLLGKLHYDDRELDPAIENFQEALKRDPSMAAAHARLAQCYLDLDHVSKAESHLKTAEALAPGEAEVMFTRGNYLVKKADLKGALENFEKTVAANPNHYLAHKNLGSIHAIRGQKAKAIEHYSRSLEIAPNQINADKIAAALEDLRQAVVGGPARK